MKEQNQQVQMKATGSLPNISQNKPWQPNDKAVLAKVIGHIFDLQKQFGKQVGQLENIIAGFCWALSDYPVELVIHGFKKYITVHSDMPAPADIRQIIDPIKPEWKPDKGYYIKLQEIFKRDGPYGLNDDEIEYINAYEEYMRRERTA